MKVVKCRVHRPGAWLRLPHSRWSVSLPYHKSELLVDMHQHTHERCECPFTQQRCQMLKGNVREGRQKCPPGERVGMAGHSLLPLVLPMQNEPRPQRTWHWPWGIPNNICLKAFKKSENCLHLKWYPPTPPYQVMPQVFKKCCEVTDSKQNA